MRYMRCVFSPILPIVGVRPFFCHHESGIWFCRTILPKRLRGLIFPSLIGAFSWELRDTERKGLIQSRCEEVLAQWFNFPLLHLWSCRQMSIQVKFYHGIARRVTSMSCEPSLKCVHLTSHYVPKTALGDHSLKFELYLRPFGMIVYALHLFWTGNNNLDNELDYRYLALRGSVYNYEIGRYIVK